MGRGGGKDDWMLQPNAFATPGEQGEQPASRLLVSSLSLSHRDCACHKYALDLDSGSNDEGSSEKLHSGMAPSVKLCLSHLTPTNNIRSQRISDTRGHRNSDAQHFIWQIFPELLMELGTYRLQIMFSAPFKLIVVIIT